MAASEQVRKVEAALAVKDVKKIKTKYFAVQWTGEESEADEIRELMTLYGVDGYFYNDTTSRYGSYAYLHSYDKRGEGGEDEMVLIRDWVVISSKGKAEVLNEERYEEKYEDA